MQERYKVYIIIIALTVLGLNFLAYLNLVVRMKLPASSDIFIGPSIAGIIIGVLASKIVLFYTNKIRRFEEAKHTELEQVQREIIYKMGEIGECRSSETGLHVKRVSEYSGLLAELYGLPKEEISTLKNASPMHDIGKVGIPDSILLKKGRLTDEEFLQMQAHAKLGYDVLCNTGKKIFEAAAIVAYEHHEKWDGSGYPRGLKAEAIHIYGRITALADVYDALSTKRVYKEIWDDERVRVYIESESGKHFDPSLATMFLEHYEKFIQIKETYKE